MYGYQYQYHIHGKIGRQDLYFAPSTGRAAGKDAKDLGPIYVTNTFLRLVCPVPMISGIMFGYFRIH